MGTNSKKEEERTIKEEEWRGNIWETHADQIRLQITLLETNKSLNKSDNCRALIGKDPQS